MDEDIKIKSLAKAAAVLNCFINRPELSLTEISEDLGYYKSNVHAILSTFKSLGYVEKNPENGKYRLGIRIFELSRSLGESFSVSNVAAPFLQEIANATGESVYLAAPHEQHVLYLSSFYPAEEYQMMRSLLGVRASMHCTGLGKVMLAFMPQEAQNKYFGTVSTLEAYTDNTITDAERLREELLKIRAQGYAVDDMEHEYGVKCVAVPIFDRQGLCAAVSISGPSLRFNEERIQNHQELLRKSVEKIQKRIY